MAVTFSLLLPMLFRYRVNGLELCDAKKAFKPWLFPAMLWYTSDTPWSHNKELNEFGEGVINCQQEFPQPNPNNCTGSIGNTSLPLNLYSTSQDKVSETWLSMGTDRNTSSVMLKNSKFHRCYMPWCPQNIFLQCVKWKVLENRVINGCGSCQLSAKKLMWNSTCYFSTTPSNYAMSSLRTNRCWDKTQTLWMSFLPPGRGSINYGCYNYQWAKSVQHWQMVGRVRQGSTDQGESDIK